MSHLSVKIGDHIIALKGDASVDIVDTNPYLNDTVESYSYPFEIPIEGNREWLGAIDDIQDDARLIGIENKPMIIYAEGIPLRTGKVATTEDQEIKDAVSVNMTSNHKSLSDLYGDLTCQDIPLPLSDMNDLKIGEMLGDVSVSGNSGYKLNLTCRYSSKSVGDGGEGSDGSDIFSILSKFGYDLFFYPGNNVRISVNCSSDRLDYRCVQLQALGFSANKQYECDAAEPYEAHTGSDGKLIVEQDYINTSAPFGETIVQPDGSQRRALYFNSRVSYLHHKKAADGTASDEVLITIPGYGPYYVLDADRPQSGICFYVMYFLEVLFKYLDVCYDPSCFDRVQDMRRLAFFTTKCKYDTGDKYIHDLDVDQRRKTDFRFAKKFDSINKWLSSRKTKGVLEPGSKKTENSSNTNSVTVSLPWCSRYRKVYDRTQDGNYYLKTIEKVPGYEKVENLSNGDKLTLYIEDEIFPDQQYDFEIYAINGEEKNEDYQYGAVVKNMFANSDNFPEMSVSSLIQSLWASFGIRFYLDQETNTVTPVFIRDIFRDKSDPIQLSGDLYTIYKNSEKITGFRMRYSNESDRKEQNSFIRKGVTDYDTAYDYQVEKSQTIVAINDYNLLAHGFDILTVGNSTCYVDITTGNAFRVKIDKQALDNGDINNLHPVLFQVAHNHGVEIGDCSDENQDYIEEVTSEFAPLELNDINYNMPNPTTAKMCPYSDVDMWNELVTTDRRIRNIVDSNISTTYYIDEVLSTDESYDPQGTDDGNSPLQSADWGNSIVMMRGGGSDAHIEYYDYNYDGFNNSKYRLVSGDYAIDTDSISVMGHEYDYNGELPGIGDENRISLKIRAFHRDKDGNILCNASVARRGLFDQFMSEYAHFILNRKLVTITGRVEAAAIQRIDWKRRYTFFGYTGWLNKVTTHITAQNGIETVTIEMYIL